MWKIYYDDESVITSDDMSWKEAPLYGVLFVVEHYGDGKQMVHMGMDYYINRDGSVISFGENNVKMHIELGIPARCAKYGRWAPNDVWQRVHDIVFSDK